MIVGLVKGAKHEPSRGKEKYIDDMEKVADTWRDSFLQESLACNCKEIN
jgi:hypothetical protein